MWRSLLYVPANVPRFIEKAPSAGADAIVLDLEDSVPDAEKARARENLADAVERCRGSADVLVRINRPLTLAVPDLETAIAAQCKAVFLPKVRNRAHIELLAEIIEERGGDIGVIAMVESAEAIAHLREIAAAPRVLGVIVGTEDIAAEIGCAPDSDIIRNVKLEMVAAAAASGVAAIGLLGSVADFKDQAKLQAIAQVSRANGFSGATCIHPSAVPILNVAFAPSDAELALAKRQIEAAAAARAAGRGSTSVDGRMVDAPVLRRAERLIAAAHRA